ncbi:hypothetical protein LPJ78_002858 [Coemansia sp. RSA 989]|nr:hypothetical protein BX667DRAFT_497936 [Coemansia mojavensis]KAJ1742227.1 hypothetical protein LPJ68_002082 [Coemansia sp. RSA 1086]KAJ1750574.1 hypothetical protein LPJ79_002771 [Coemansia sp. RSA 1821]KAJ1865164.1 hypothetical protein LPJ78_002858 [Coemansia sp. RSA 989]KAJ1872493.1 hypothetical protein LPJ55_003029 [Coemansia sp. RSA 990]KAJ2626901.1 hypothetical protein H4R22_004635 [Coemansia sp. RSA 1290]KAJ2653517.1 hypothetical protein IWW40_000210 [Coemansia sp. RSA 1250]KAJ26772
MSEHVVSLQAYAKAVLHCAKYPWATVHGLLLTETKNNKTRYVDAIPLAHSWPQLTAMFDVALQQAQLFAKTKNLKIGGYYVAYEDPNNIQLSASSSLLAKALLETNRDAVAFVINAKQLTPESSKPGLIPYVYADSKWKEQSGAFGDKSGGFVMENNQVLAATKRLVAERAEAIVHDFDEHLDDVALDWLQNPLLNERIKTG